jgi:DNA-binding transcriptional LysR family regulator
MDFRQLEMFIAVAENSSFTLAGRQLNVAQSAISRKIKMLEIELGECLFKRVNKHVYLTPAGDLLLRSSRGIFQQLRNTALEISEMAQLKKGTVRIGSGMTACMYLLPPVLDRFRRTYPNVELRVVTGTSEVLISQLQRSLLDLGVLTLPVTAPDLQVVPFHSEELVVATSPRHPVLGRRRAVSAQELANHPMILFSRGAVTREIVNHFFEERGIQPRIAMESESVATIIPLVQINLGIAILPVRAVLAAARRSELHYLRISDAKLTRKLGLVTQKSDYHPRVVRELIDMFRASEDSGTAGTQRSQRNRAGRVNARCDI